MVSYSKRIVGRGWVGRGHSPCLLSGLASLLLLLACAESAGPPERRSILLVTLDATRADALSCYGEDPRAHTPRLDELAAQGVLFRNAITTTPYTGAAHASLLTGLYPPQHGLRDFGFQAMSEEALSLPEMLSQAGYESAAFLSAYVLDARYGLDQGFDVYRAEFRKGRRRDEPSPGPAPTHQAERPANETVDEALAWLDARPDPDRPFFLWLHLYDPHAPYAPPPAFRGPAVRGEGHRARVARGHYEEVSFADAEVGRLLDGLTARGQRDDLVVAVVADHGDVLWEKGWKAGTHSPVLFDLTLRVPFLMQVPGDWAPDEVVDQVRTVDLVPTLLEAVGLPAPENLAGRTLYPLVAGRDDAPRPAYSETYYEHYPQRARDRNELRSLRESGWKLIERPGRVELYDLTRDPDEERDLAAVHPERVEAMRESLTTLRAGMKPLGKARFALADDEVDQHMEFLRALGYAE